MINVNRLKGKFVENGFTQADIARSLGVTPRTLQNKLKAQNFSVQDIDRLSCVLHLTLSEVSNIFFAQFDA